MELKKELTGILTDRPATEAELTRVKALETLRMPGSRETIEWASHPSRKYTYLQTFSPASALARYMAMYKEAAEKQGYTATAEQVGWAVPTYVGETDARAHAEAKPHIEAFMNKFLRMPPEMLLPPGPGTAGRLQGHPRAA